MEKEAYFGIFIKGFNHYLPESDTYKGSIMVFMDQYARLYYRHSDSTINCQVKVMRKTNYTETPRVDFYVLIPSSKQYELDEVVHISYFKNYDKIEAGEIEYLGIKISESAKELLEKERFSQFYLNNKLYVKVRDLIYTITTEDSYFRDFYFESWEKPRERVIKDVSIEDCLNISSKIDSYVGLFRDDKRVLNIINSYTVEINEKLYYKVGGDDRLEAWLYSKIDYPTCPVGQDSYLSLSSLGINFTDHYKETAYGARLPREWYNRRTENKLKGKERLIAFFETEYNSDSHKMALMRQYILSGHDDDSKYFLESIKRLNNHIYALLAWKYDFPRMTELNYLKIITESQDNPVRCPDSFYRTTNVEIDTYTQLKTNKKRG